MPIIASEPVEIPATTLDKIWLSRVEIIVPSATAPTSATIFSYYTNDSGQRGPTKQYRLNDLLTKINNNTTPLEQKIRAAYLAILDVVQDLETNGVPNE